MNNNTVDINNNAVVSISKSPSNYALSTKEAIASLVNPSTSFTNGLPSVQPSSPTETMTTSSLLQQQLLQQQIQQQETKLQQLQQQQQQQTPANLNSLKMLNGKFNYF